MVDGHRPASDRCSAGGMETSRDRHLAVRPHFGDMEMTRSEVWRSFIKSDTRKLHAGEKVATTLLGRVHGFVRDDCLVGVITCELRAEARNHGFRIVGASVQDGTYILEKL